MARYTVVAVSGGVDSLVAAHLLKCRGERVTGVHFTHGYEDPESIPSDTAGEIGRQLGIPVQVLDVASAFSNRVVRYFIDSYARGLTPNPCMVCNPAIKFGMLLDHARAMGASHLATGHYARIRTGPDGRRHLCRGIDGEKEQSYFLAFLNPAQLAAALFPLGAFTKSQTVRMAAENGLKPVTAGESQDVCFIRKEAYGAFLARQEAFPAQPGPIVDTAGNVIGRHRGLHLFTVGQRRGIDCPAARPYYVVRLDPAGNRLVVGFREETLTRGCRVSGINWIGERPERPIRLETRVRYRSRAVSATVAPRGASRATVRFDEPQSGVTPGQAAVFYQGDVVWGGGWIDPPTEEP